METNVGKRTYRQIETLADEINNLGAQQSKPAATGLLAPMSFKKQEGDTAVEQPAYRVAQYFNTIRNKRMELKRG